MSFLLHKTFTIVGLSESSKTSCHIHVAVTSIGFDEFLFIFPSLGKTFYGMHSTNSILLKTLVIVYGTKWQDYKCDKKGIHIRNIGKDS